MTSCEFRYERRSCPKCGTKYLVPLDAYEVDHRMLDRIRELEIEAMKARARTHKLELLANRLMTCVTYLSLGGRMSSYDYAELENSMIDLGLKVRCEEKESE